MECRAALQGPVHQLLLGALKRPQVRQDQSGSGGVYGKQLPAGPTGLAEHIPAPRGVRVSTPMQSMQAWVPCTSGGYGKQVPDGPAGLGNQTPAPVGLLDSMHGLCSRHLSMCSQPVQSSEHAMSGWQLLKLPNSVTTTHHHGVATNILIVYSLLTAVCSAQVAMTAMFWTKPQSTLWRDVQ